MMKKGMAVILSAAMLFSVIPGNVYAANFTADAGEEAILEAEEADSGSADFTDAAEESSGGESAVYEDADVDTDADETVAFEDEEAEEAGADTTDNVESAAEETTAGTTETTETTETTDSSVIESGTCGADGDNLTWTLTGDGTLTISGIGRMANYSYNTSPWTKDKVSKVILYSGVTSIGSSAFQGCNSLSSITMPDGLTSIGCSAFDCCYTLTDITIPDGVTVINADTFRRCTRLTSITIPASITTIISCAFSSCYKITDIYFTGTKDEWNSIDIGTESSWVLEKATIHYLDLANRAQIEVEEVKQVPLGGTECEAAVFKVKCLRSEDSGTVKWSSSNPAVFELTGDTSGTYASPETEFMITGNGHLPGTSTIEIVTGVGVTESFTVSISGTVALIDSWDADSQTFATSNGSSYKVTGNTEIEGNISDFVDDFALICQKDEDIAVYNITSAIGTYTGYTDTTVTIDGKELPSVDKPLLYIDSQKVIYHIYNGYVISMDYIEKGSGIFEEWDFSEQTATFRMVVGMTDRKSYKTFNLTDKSFLNYAAQILDWNVTYEYTAGRLISVIPSGIKEATKQFESYDKTTGQISFKDESPYNVEDGVTLNLKGVKKGSWVNCTLGMIDGNIYVAEVEKIAANPKIYITLFAGSDIEYKNGKLRYSGDEDYEGKSSFEIPFTISINNFISAEGLTSNELASDSTLSCTIDSLEVTVSDGFNFGWFGGGDVELEEPVTLKAGENINLTGYIRADAGFDLGGKLEKTYSIKAAGGTNQGKISATSKFTVTDMEQEEAQTEITETAKAAADELNSLDIDQIIAINPNAEALMNVLGLKGNDKTLFLQELLTEIIMSNTPEDTFDKKISDKILQKVFKYKDDLDATSYTCSFTYLIDTPNYGTVELTLNCDIADFSYSSNPLGKLANINYQLDFKESGSSGDPCPSSGDFGTMAYADVESFSKAAYNTLESQIKTAYNTAWGNDADQAAQLIFGDTVTRILKEGNTSYKDIFWKLATAPSKTMMAACPVNVYVYDASGNLCGSIENNTVTLKSDDFGLSVDGEKKYVTGLTNEYTIKYVATDDGSMDVTVTEYLGYDSPIRKVSYTQIPLVKDGYYEQEISREFLKPASEYNLFSETESEIVPTADDTYLSFPSKGDANIEKQEQKLEGTLSYSKKAGDEAFYLDVTRTAGNGTLSYSSSNPAVAEVSSDGLVTILSAGSTELTVTAAENRIYKSCIFKVTLTVAAAQNPEGGNGSSADSKGSTSGQNSGSGSSGAMSVKVKKITLSGNKKIAAGKKTALKLKISPANASNQAVTWKSGNTKVATVNQKGVVTFKKNSGGKSVVIYAVSKDGSGIKGSVRLKSMKGVVRKITLSGKTTVKTGKSVKLKAAVKASKGANTKLAWSSSNTRYATVNSSGKVTTKKAGKGKKVKITAIATDGSGKKKTITIKIR